MCLKPNLDHTGADTNRHTRTYARTDTQTAEEREGTVELIKWYVLKGDNDGFLMVKK